MISGIAEKFVKSLNKLLSRCPFFVNLCVTIIFVRTDFKVFFGESDSTEVIRPILEKIEVEDKTGVDADACYIHLKATEMLVIQRRVRM